MEDDIAKALAYQVKKELAERYFGFRRLIEEDTARYFKGIEETKKVLKKRLAPEFFRLYTLLVEPELQDELRQILGLKYLPFLEDYQKLSLEEKKALFKELHPKGFTSKGRFKRLLEDTYQRLWKKFQEYNETFQNLKVESEIINEEIKRFKEKFDLSEIMQFLKSFEMTAESSLGHPDFKESVTSLEEELKFQKIASPEQFLPEIKDLPEPQKVHSPLERLANKAWKRHKSWSKELVKIACSEK